MRTQRTVLVLLIATVAGLTACGPGKGATVSGKGGFTEAYPVVTPQPTSTPLPTSTPSPTGAPTLIRGLPTGTPTTPSASPPPANGVKVTVTVNQQSSPALLDCPPTYHVTGKITVSKGPVDLVYFWNPHTGLYRGFPPPKYTLHFGGSGKQTKQLSIDAMPESAYGASLYEQLVVVGYPYDMAHDSTTWTENCGATASTPTVDRTNQACPYAATFSSTVSVPAGPQPVAVQWHFSDGSTSDVQAMTFSGTGPDSHVVTVTKTVSGSPTTILGGLSAWLVVLSKPGMTTRKVSATCATPVLQ